MADTSRLPQWQSHKVVHAAKIDHLEGEILFLDIGPIHIDVKAAPNMFARYTPVPGDYYVVYDDGYASISPKQAFESGYHRFGAPAPILMGPHNPTGWKLEELLPHIAGEVEAKTLKIAADPRPVARLVAENNGRIVKLLEEAEKLQRENYEALDAMAPNQGPLGKPRIGVGSEAA